MNSATIRTADTGVLIAHISGEAFLHIMRTRRGHWTTVKYAARPGVQQTVWVLDEDVEWNSPGGDFKFLIWSGSRFQEQTS